MVLSRDLASEERALLVRVTPRVEAAMVSSCPSTGSMSRRFVVSWSREGTTRWPCLRCAQTQSCAGQQFRAVCGMSSGAQFDTVLDQRAEWSMSVQSTMPAVFLGHGNPMNALAHNSFTDRWAQLGSSIPRPKAILSVSAHWYLPEVAVTASSQPRTIHDFGGFPKPLHEVEYPAPGSPELAHRVRELLSPISVRSDRNWGFDHGTWSVLVHMYPAADIPVVQLSIDETREASWHYEAAKQLQPLRDEGVLILAAGTSCTTCIRTPGAAVPQEPMTGHSDLRSKHAS